MFKNKHNGYSPDGSRTYNKGGSQGGTIGKRLVGGSVGNLYKTLAGGGAAGKRLAASGVRFIKTQAASNAEKTKTGGAAEKITTEATGLLSGELAALSGGSSPTLTRLEDVYAGSLLLGRKMALGG